MSDRLTKRIGMLRHALGLSRAKKAYRNHYCAEPGDVDCQWLTEHGLFVKVNNNVPTGGLETFMVTDLGKDVAMLLAKAPESGWLIERKGVDADHAAFSALSRIGAATMHSDGITVREWRLTNV